MQQVDYKDIGLRVGIEVHQQLNTRNKMFCACPTELSTREPESRFIRRLRPTQSELGQIDPAALFEFQKGRRVLYEVDRETSCLVEGDEEPPHELNREAIDIALVTSLLAECTPVDEIHTMRKIVIDGSNTTGFQRTCIVAMDGEIQLNGTKVPVTQISLEEDAARKTSEAGMLVNYRLDRLGIPLIEVTTSPCAHSPMEAEQIAAAIGRLLRATGQVRRGLGTIRQDLNISITGGALTEIKGVQKLDLISKVVEFEVQRQLRLIDISKTLATRNLREESFQENFADITGLLRKSSSKMIKEALENGGVVMVVKLPYFNGLLKIELEPGLRLGTEMAHRAAFWGRVKGILHSDELPGYGISKDELASILKTLGAREDDAVVLVAAPRENCIDALRAVVSRAKEALHGVPEETRMSNEDGTTKYMRPRPGAARMYPETDVPPIQVSAERLEHLRSNLPPLPDVIMKQLAQRYGLNRKLTEQLINSEYLPLFEALTKNSQLASSFIATMLTETLKALARDGTPIDKLTDDAISGCFDLVSKGITAKESLPAILTWISKNPEATPLEAVEKLSVKMLDENEVKRIVEEKIQASEALIQELGPSSQGKIIGLVMAQIRGRADPGVVAEIVRRRLTEADAKSGTRR